MWRTVILCVFLCVGGGGGGCGSGLTQMDEHSVRVLEQMRPDRD